MVVVGRVVVVVKGAELCALVCTLTNLRTITLLLAALEEDDEDTDRVLETGDTDADVLILVVSGPVTNVVTVNGRGLSSGMISLLRSPSNAVSLESPLLLVCVNDRCLWWGLVAVVGDDGDDDDSVAADGFSAMNSDRNS